MKIKYIIIVMLLISLSTLFININKSFAAGSCKIELIPDKTNIKPGEKVTFELKATDITMSDGICDIIGYINYNSDLFEDCEFVASDTWEDSAQDFREAYPEDFKDYFFFTTKFPSSANQVIAKISLKAKTNATVGKTEVTLTGAEDDGVIVKGPNSDDEMEINDISVPLTIVSESAPNPVTPDPTPEPMPDPTPETQPNPTPESTPDEEEDEEDDEDDEDEDIEKPSKDMQKTTSSSDLPNTGRLGIGKILIVISIIGFAILSYKKYNKWKKI